ncbi:MAG: lysophospholipid acyltransferase family protein [Thermoanaerobaculia bacterium]
MQAKIPRSGNFSERLNRWAIRRGFPVLAWIAPRAPRWFLFVNARWIIAVVFFFHSRPKLAIARNLGRVLDAPPESAQVRRATDAMLRHLAYYWVDLFRFPQLPRERLRELIVGGDERALDPLRERLARGERVLLMTAHLGNWELGAVMLGQAGLPLAIIYVPDEFEEAEQFRSFMRNLSSVSEIPLPPDDRFASLAVLRAFGEGRLVALQGDRDFRESGVEMTFFGAKTAFPTGPFLLARMTGAILLPTFIAYAPDLRFEVEHGVPISVPRTADRDADVRQAMEQWVATLEAAVRRWPTQWYTFYDFWNSGEGHA